MSFLGRYDVNPKPPFNEVELFLENISLRFGAKHELP